MKIKTFGLDMPPPNTEVLFIDFANLEEIHRYHPNSLALTLGKKLVEQMGGKIKVNSRGTVFTVSFKIASDTNSSIDFSKSLSSLPRSERVSR
jgi:hypothetical protein